MTMRKRRTGTGKKMSVILAVCTAAMLAAACGQEKEASLEETAVEQSAVGEAAGEKKDNEVLEETAIDASAEAGVETEQDESAGTTEETAVSGGLENFDADQDQVKEFARKVQKTVAERDMQGLADCMTFPNYVSIYEEKSGMVDTEEEFLSIGADRIFTEEFTASIANADLGNMEASMAGFLIVSKEDSAAPSVTFGISKGELKITGINY